MSNQNTIITNFKNKFPNYDTYLNYFFYYHKENQEIIKDLETLSIQEIQIIIPTIASYYKNPDIAKILTKTNPSLINKEAWKSIISLPLNKTLDIYEKCFPYLHHHPDIKYIEKTLLTQIFAFTYGSTTEGQEKLKNLYKTENIINYVVKYFDKSKKFRKTHTENILVHITNNINSIQITQKNIIKILTAILIMQIKTTNPTPQPSLFPLHINENQIQKIKNHTTSTYVIKAILDLTQLTNFTTIKKHIKNLMLLDYTPEQMEALEIQYKLTTNNK